LLRPLIVLVGPTAVGKTAVAVAVGEKLGAEIVSADSRQVYRGLDIGTAKPTLEERRRVPHHLIDVIAPDEEFGLAQFQALARAAIEDILARGKLPFLVGGTGQYVRAVTEGWNIPPVPPHWELRAELLELARQKGAAALHARLQALDPVAAAHIDPRNVRRVIRALEVGLVTGCPISEWQRKQPLDYHLLQLGLTMERSQLYQRADQRIERMIAHGLVSEVQALLAQGYDQELPAMSGLGYRQIVRYLQGHFSLEEAVTAIKRDTRRFIRHQYNWFRLSDPRIRWFDMGAGMDTIVGKVLDVVKRFLVEIGWPSVERAGEC